MISVMRNALLSLTSEKNKKKSHYLDEEGSSNKQETKSHPRRGDLPAKFFFVRFVDELKTILHLNLLNSQ